MVRLPGSLNALPSDLLRCAMPDSTPRTKANIGADRIAQNRHLLCSRLFATRCFKLFRRGREFMQEIVRFGRGEMPPLSPTAGPSTPDLMQYWWVVRQRWLLICTV